MAVLFIRAVILYAAVIFVIRLMGKRQIGEMQPSELVITILISEVASLPLQDKGIPVLYALVPLFVFVSFEIILSALSLKSRKLRTLMQGHEVIVIKNGKVDIEALRTLRMTFDDLEGALRQKDVFDVKEVSCAIFETNGKLSVLLKKDDTKKEKKKK